jgi:Protein of unknown function (DUF3159)
VPQRHRFSWISNHWDDLGERNVHDRPTTGPSATRRRASDQPAACGPVRAGQVRTDVARPDGRPNGVRLLGDSGGRVRDSERGLVAVFDDRHRARFGVGIGRCPAVAWGGFAQAIGSLLGVAVASGVVASTGSARDFFAIGIWLSLAGFVVTLGSVLARRPLSGVVWNLVNGGTHSWRADRPTLRAHVVATLAAAVVFGSRFVIQQWLYVADSTTGLGIARLLMGTPLTVLAAFVVVWAFRRSTKRLIPRGPSASQGPAQPVATVRRTARPARRSGPPAGGASVSRPVS